MNSAAAFASTSRFGRLPLSDSKARLQLLRLTFLQLDHGEPLPLSAQALLGHALDIAAPSKPVKSRWGRKRVINMTKIP
jgi:hypothetical protein